MLKPIFKMLKPIFLMFQFRTFSRFPLDVGTYFYMLGTSINSGCGVRAHLHICCVAVVVVLRNLLIYKGNKIWG